MSMAAVESIAVSSFMISLRHVWGKLYSNEDAVVKHLASIMPLIAISACLDGIQRALSGTIRKSDELPK